MPYKQKKQLVSAEQSYQVYSEWASGGGRATEQARKYHEIRFVKILFVILCLAAIVLVTGIAVTIGEYPIGILESYTIIWDHLIGNVGEDYDSMMRDHIVCNLRMPRIAYAIVAGVGLGIAGAVMQSTLKNPMADPYTTGVSSGASFGATLAISLMGGAVIGDPKVIISAFVMSLVPTSVIIALSVIRKSSPVSMILAGIAITYIFGAMTTLIELWTDPDSLNAINWWQAGSLDGLKWSDFPTMLIVVSVGSVLILMVSNKLNLLSAGDDSAKAMGLDASRFRIICLMIVSLMSATIVSFTGIIGFVGLVAPHISRLFIGADNKFLIPASALFGAVLLMVSDLIGRTIMSPTIIQVGVITAFLGGPLFLYLIIRSRREAW